MLYVDIYRCPYSSLTYHKLILLFMEVSDNLEKYHRKEGAKESLKVKLYFIQVEETKK